MNEIATRLKDSVIANDSIQVDRLPPRLRSIFVDCIKPMNSDVPDESLMLDLLVKIAQLLSVHRTTVVSGKGEVLINIYALIFMPSGSGKDKPLVFIDKHFMPLFKEKFEMKSKNYQERRLKELEEEADDKYSSRAKAMKAKYIETNLPRQLVPEISNATAEGMQALRETLSNAGFGGTFLKISEFGDYISSDNSARGEFLSLLTEVFDMGTNSPKVIKSEKTAKEVTGVPSNAIMHSSFAHLTEGPSYKKLMTLVDRGLARRSFICFPALGKFNHNVKEESLMDEFKKQRAVQETIKNTVDKYKHFWEEAYEATRNGRVWKLTEEAEEVLFMYEKHLQLQVNAVSITEDEGYRAELKGRYWKTLKLAGLLAIWEHPDDIEVNASDIRNAIYLAEVYGNHTREFYQVETVVDVERLRDYFLRNLNTWKTTTEISKQKFTPGKNLFRRWFDENIVECENLLLDKGYKLEAKKFSKNGYQYRAVAVELADLNKIKLSVSKDITSGYRLKEVPFDQIHEIITADVNYSPSEFSEGYRDREHWIDGNNVIILDIDNGWTRKEAKQFLTQEGLKAFICTTKSHMKQKDKKPPCERFRIVLPVYSPFRGTYDEFSFMMDNIFKYFKGKPDKAAKDVSRFYFGHKGEYEYIDGVPLRLELFPKSKVEEKKTSYSSNNWSTNQGIKKWFTENAVPGDRNNTLSKARLFALDNGIDPEHFVRGINEQLSDPLDEKELNLLLRKR